MTQAVMAQNGIGALERVLIEGDLGVLTPEERVLYYQKVCESVGLNALTKPFDYIRLNNKLVLYANRNCSDQLRSTRKINTSIVAREKVEDVYVVTVRAMMPDGRQDEAIGAVAVGGLKGEALANAFMKSETKAKRRVTLSICGLSFADETEIGSIPNAEPVQVDDRGEIIGAAQLPAPLREHSAATRVVDPPPADAPQQPRQSGPIPLTHCPQHNELLQHPLVPGESPGHIVDGDWCSAVEVLHAQLAEMVTELGASIREADGLLTEAGRPAWPDLTAEQRFQALPWLRRKLSAQQRAGAGA